MTQEQCDFLVKSKTYLTKEQYVSGRIIEYDIQKANINMLRLSGLIDNDYYNLLYNLPKKDREIEIGNLIRSDKKYYDAINNGIDNTIRKFIEINGVEFDSVIRRANDALYINTPIDMKYDIIDNISFRHDKIYLSFLNLNRNILLFFFIDSNGDWNADIKGLGKGEEYHNGYMLSVIGYTIFILEKFGSSDALTYISQFIDDYINLRVDPEYYRRMDSHSLFQLKGNGFTFSSVDEIPDIKLLDIDYNLYFLRLLHQIIFGIYSKTK